MDIFQIGFATSTSLVMRDPLGGTIIVEGSNPSGLLFFRSFYKVYNETNERIRNMNDTLLQSLERAQELLNDEATKLEDKIVAAKDSVSQYYLLASLAEVHNKVGEIDYQIREIKSGVKQTKTFWQRLLEW